MRCLPPTAYDNLRIALQNDLEWWSENQEAMDQRFAAWLGE